MCGIAGELRFDGQAPDAAIVRRTATVLARRGPDGEGFWNAGSVALAHRRLAIIDLSERASQPMVDAALGLALVFNGTIYNYPELRAELRALGHVFFSNGDTEVILRAYAQWGEACVERLHGMYAFALWNGRRQELFLARDRLGIKPLYFTQTATHFRFASTLQALLAAGDVDMLWIETMSDLGEVEAAVSGARYGAPQLPLAVTMTYESRGRTMMGVKPQQAAAAMKAAGVKIIGANCGTGPDGVEQVIAVLHEAYPEATIIAKANAGLPHMEAGVTTYDGTPEVMAGYAQRARDLGATLIGACCGSTPAHIQAMASALSRQES